MKRLLALGLMAGAAVPAAAAGDAPSSAIVPFAVQERVADCTGPGKSAIRVLFDVKGVKARFGTSDKSRVHTCHIKTRRAGEIREIPIPCAEDRAPLAAKAADLDRWPRRADLSGDVVACVGVDSVRLVAGRWAVAADTPGGRVAQQGDLSSAGVTVIYQGPRSGPDEPDAQNFRAMPPVLALVWDRVATGLDSAAGPVSLSSYLLVSPAVASNDNCAGANCYRFDPTPGAVIQQLGGYNLGQVVVYVDGR
jgi:hypothetical protein